MTMATVDAKTAISMPTERLLGLVGQAVLAQATNLARRGRYSDAQRLLEGLEEDSVRRADVLDLLARIQAQQGRFDEAAALWRRVLDTDPHDESAVAALRRISLLRRRPRWRGVIWPATALVIVAVLAGVILLVGNQFVTHDQALATRLSALETMGQATAAKVDELGRHLSSSADGVSSGNAATDASAFMSSPIVQANEALRSDKKLTMYGIALRQIGDSLYLYGNLPSADLKVHAEAVARAATGGIAIDASGLTVVPPSLDEAARAALRTDPRTIGLALDVEQIGADLRLRGEVPTLDAKDAAESIARAIPGVSLVDSGGLRVRPSMIEYVVQPGDSLSSIAQTFYGDYRSWPKILEANHEVVVDAAVILPGSRLRIPLNTQ